MLSFNDKIWIAGSVNEMRAKCILSNPLTKPLSAFIFLYQFSNPVNSFKFINIFIFSNQFKVLCDLISHLPSSPEKNIWIV